MIPEKIKTKSPARFIYDQKGLTGFENPKSRAFQIVRELIENSLDSCERGKILPSIILKVKSLGEGFYRIICVDNGLGVREKDIPLAFGTMLSSSKYVNRQDRGLFGIGIKNVLLFGQVTTSKPFRIISAPSKMHDLVIIDLMVDINKNQPKIINRERKENKYGWKGLTLRFDIRNVNFEQALNEILQYLKLTSAIVPCSEITFEFNNRKFKFERKSKNPPNPPLEVAPHPYDIDPLDFELMIRNTEETNMLKFLRKHFHRVGPTTAKTFLNHIKIDVNKDPHTLTHKECIYILNRMKKFKWVPPSTKCLSLIGEENFKVGISGLYNDVKFISYSSRKDVFGGSPFGVEVCVCVLGKHQKKSQAGRSEMDYVKLHRIVNKIPLVRQYKSCLMYKVCEDLNWYHYKIDTSITPLVIFTHVCSTSKRTLFKDLTKGIIADIPEIRRALELSLKDCLRKVNLYLSEIRRFEYKKKRISIFESYGQLVAESLGYIVRKRKDEVYGLIKGLIGVD